MTDNADGLKYDFDVTPDSTYVRAAAMIAASGSTGRVADLGAGVGALATALSARGLGYLGFDFNANSVVEMRRRGVEAHELDILASDAVERVVVSAGPTPDDPVIALAVLDVIEHLPDPERTLRVLTDLADRIAELQDGQHPLLVLSVPNVAHSDLGAKLIAGRWDVTEVGLLDQTHISLFTESRLDQVLDGRFVEVSRDDVEFVATEQRDNIDHPVFAQSGLGAYLRHVRERSDQWASVYQFVRAYRRSTSDDATAASGADVVGPFCSVIVRTQGNRRSLIDTLTSLAAQSDRDLEVLLMVHHSDAEIVAAIRRHVASFGDDFASVVRVHQVLGGGRSKPLNRALEVAHGRYVAVLDDDDIVTSDWVAEFRRLADLHPGAVVRCSCVEQMIERRDTPLFDFEAVSGFETPHPVHLDLFDLVRANRSPQCSYAVPVAAVRALDICFDDAQRVCEDWKFQLDAVRYAGIAASPSVTSVYRRWSGSGGSATAEERETWLTDHEKVIDDLDTVPTVMPPGILRRLHDLYTIIEGLEKELGRRSDGDGPRRFTD